MAKYIFRLDDICPNTDWVKFERINKVFSAYNIKPIIAVVPDNKDPKLNKGESKPNFWEWVERLNSLGWKIAMHGYQHVYTQESGGILKIHTKSEFATLPYNDQVTKIHAGKCILEEKNIKTDIFIAPGHSFDKDTLRALKTEGFTVISDGVGLYPFKNLGMVWIPQVAWGPRKFPLGFITFCLHPNTMEEIDFEVFEDFVKKEQKNIVDFDYFLDWEKNKNWTKSLWSGCFNFVFRIYWNYKFSR